MQSGGWTCLFGESSGLVPLARRSCRWSSQFGCPQLHPLLHPRLRPREAGVHEAAASGTQERAAPGDVDDNIDDAVTQGRAECIASVPQAVFMSCFWPPGGGPGPAGKPLSTLCSDPKGAVSVPPGEPEAGAAVVQHLSPLGPCTAPSARHHRP